MAPNLDPRIWGLSHKTIDGRGQRIKLTGKGLRLKECEHVIICNLEFEGGRGHDVDAIQIKPHSKHIWIDRCSLRDYADALIDITRESTDITISRWTDQNYEVNLTFFLVYINLTICLYIAFRCHFSQHDKTMLIGADASHTGDRCIRITIHHCFFDGTRQRHPRVRFAKVHLYNNYTRNWGIYAICASVESQVLLPAGSEIFFFDIQSLNFTYKIYFASDILAMQYLWSWTEEGSI